jgi:hypothetical protein
MANDQNCVLPDSTAFGRKRPYKTPTLAVYGEVAALTQAQSGCSMSDSPACATDPGAMGAKT